jgi:hypothetical protein
MKSVTFNNIIIIVYPINYNMAKNKKKLTSIVMLLSVSNAAELKSKEAGYKKAEEFAPGFIPQAPWPQNFENL